MIISQEEYDKNEYLKRRYGTYSQYIESIEVNVNNPIAKDYCEYFSSKVNNVISSSYAIFPDEDIMKIFLIVAIDDFKYNVNILITIKETKFVPDCAAYMAKLDTDDFETLDCRCQRSKIKSLKYLTDLNEAIDFEYYIQTNDES